MKIEHCNRSVFYHFFKAGSEMVRHDGVEHSGYMAFLNLLSFFPFIVFVVALSGFLGVSLLGDNFMDILLQNLPEHIKNALKPVLEEVTSGPSQGLLTVSILGVVWTASSSVEGVRTILNRVYHVTSPPAYVMRRLLSIVQFLALSILVVISMLILVLLPIIYDKLNDFVEIQTYINSMANIDLLSPIWKKARYAALFVTLFVVVSTLYYVIPNTKMSFKSIVPGSILVVVLWVVSGFGLTSYIRNFDQVNIIYGSLGGIIATLLFFFFINVIFIYGAEFNYLLSRGNVRRA